MKAHSGSHVHATVLAALAIVGWCLGAIRWAEKQRGSQRRQLEDAVQSWEAEGGAVSLNEDEEDQVPSLR
jgi:hypothetical protein